MKSANCKWLKRSQAFMTVAISIIFLPLSVHAEQKQDRSFLVRGIAVTGINEHCGSPVFNLPLPPALPPTIRATNLGEYNPGGALPIALSSTNCGGDIALATTTDTDFLAAAGIPDANPGVKNIPLRQNFVITEQDGSRSQLPSLGQVPGNALPPTKSEPNNTITLGNWLKARGKLLIKCNSKGKATIEANFHNLIPNGVYSMWGVWTTTPPGAPIIPLPLGGVPNALIPDHHGNASFFRQLASCPMDVTEDGSLMMFITLAYHSDSNLYGALPELGAAPTTIHPAVGDAFTTTFVPGVATHDAIEFPINAEVLQ